MMLTCLFTLFRELQSPNNLYSTCKPDYIDFSIINYCETGTPDSQRHIRAWMKNLSEYIHSVDLVRSRPVIQIIREHPERTVPSVLAVEGEEYSIYMPDGRKPDESGSGETLCGEISCGIRGRTPTIN